MGLSSPDRARRGARLLRELARADAGLVSIVFSADLTTASLQGSS